MATLAIRKRLTKSGERRFDVRYRVGGSDTPILHGGTFKTRKEARARLELGR